MTTAQWALGAGGALVIGFSKTGVPGTGILAVPMLAAAFGARLSIGATLPLLLSADVLAVIAYRAHGDAATLRRLAPWVIGGMLVGVAALKGLGDAHPSRDWLNPLIGGIVLAMLGLSLVKDRFKPKTSAETGATGVLSGFATMVSNAAGPIMQIYLVGSGLAKDALMGTTALYFLIFNALKIPAIAYLAWDNPGAPIVSRETLLFNLLVLPVLLVGARIGRTTYRRIPAARFTQLILALSAVGALKLLLS